jgi:hypothetical protein
MPTDERAMRLRSTEARAAAGATAGLETKKGGALADAAP